MRSSEILSLLSANPPVIELPATMPALIGEEVLLSETGEGTEVGAAEVRDLGGLPAVQAVARGHGLEDPGVHGKGLEPAGAEEQDAVGDFFPDAG